MFTYITAKRIIFRFHMCLFIFWYNPLTTCVYGEVSIEQQGPIPPQWDPPQGASQDKGAVGLEHHIFLDDHIANTKSEFWQNIKHTPIGMILHRMITRTAKRESAVWRRSRGKECYSIITVGHSYSHWPLLEVMWLVSDCQKTTSKFWNMFCYPK